MHPVRPSEKCIRSGTWSLPDEVCVTFESGEQTPEDVAERLREYLARDPRELQADLGQPERTSVDDLHVAVRSEVSATHAVVDHVYAYGVTWDFSEAADWRVALRDFPTDCDWFLDVYTQEAGYMGQGHLFYRMDDEYVPVDEYRTTEGGYADELIDYFAVEHDLRPLTFSLMNLD